VVLVMAPRDPALDDIREQLEQLDVVLKPLGSLLEFQQLIQREQPPEVVITGVSLTDGNWCDVLTSTVRAGLPARVLVCSHEADERFWSEAIWRGVHDILVAPFTTEYLRRSVEIRGGRAPGGQSGEANPGRGREAKERPDIFEASPIDIAIGAVA
jgi:DNA-binding NtrC family response regulator